MTDQAMDKTAHENDGLTTGTRLQVNNQNLLLVQYLLPRAEVDCLLG